MPPPKKVTPAKPVAATPAPAVAPMPSPVIEKSEVKGSGKPKIPAATPSTARTPSHTEIQKRAFEIYSGRGYAPGDPAADWLEAERQLKAGL